MSAPIWLLLGLVACGGSTPAETGDTGASTDTSDTSDTGDTADSGETGETGETGDTGETNETGDTGLVGDEGLLSWVGDATIGDGWEGSESVRFVAQSGLGDTLCDVRYPVTSLRVRDDCADCVVAYDVVFGAPEVLTDTACAAAGYDAATIAAGEGEERAYGFALDYVGHANVLMRYEDERWQAVSFVDWNEAKERIVYNWEQGYVEY